jgi:C1A family cysteine protease
MKRVYGWKKSPPDERDYFYKVVKPVKLPASVDLRPGISKTFDQGALGSCVAHGVGSLDKFVKEKQNHRPFDPSRLFIYYEGRKLEGTIDEDSGLYVRDGMKVINKMGAPGEHLWPYDISKFTQKPPKNAYINAATNQSIIYSQVPQTLTALKGCLAEGYPFTFGFEVYEYFESWEMQITGILKVPTADEQYLGGHCVLCVGYNTATKRFLVLNSWGEDWGLKGYFWMPNAYMTDWNLVSDIWTIRKMEV